MALRAAAGRSGPVQWGAWESSRVGRCWPPAGWDGTVRLWDPPENAASGQPLAGQRPVWWGAWGRSGVEPVLATGGDAGSVRLWEVVEDRPCPVAVLSVGWTVPVDELSRMGDAVALAELLPLLRRRRRWPWGCSGTGERARATFLGYATAGGRDCPPGNPLAIPAVRQVRFNAWHYAETDLWASLVAELFAQLAVPPDGDLGAEQRRQSRLAADLVMRRGFGSGCRQPAPAMTTCRRRCRRPGETTVGSWEALPERDSGCGLRSWRGRGGRSTVMLCGLALAAGTGRASWRLLRDALPGDGPRLVIVLSCGRLPLRLWSRWVIPGPGALVCDGISGSGIAGGCQLWRPRRAETAKHAGAAWKTAVRMARCNDSGCRPPRRGRRGGRRAGTGDAEPHRRRATGRDGRRSRGWRGVP